MVQRSGVSTAGRIHLWNLSSEKSSQRLEALGAEVIGSGPAELDAFRRAELAKWNRLAKENKLQLD